MENDIFNGIPSVAHPIYRNTDVGSARCRVHIELFNKYKFNIGCVMEFLFEVVDETASGNIISSSILICTAIPHSVYMPISTICFDDTVVLPFQDDFPLNSSNIWNMSKYKYNLKIQKVYPPACTISSMKCVEVNKDKENILTLTKNELGIEMDTNFDLSCVNWLDLEQVRNNEIKGSNDACSHRIKNVSRGISAVLSGAHVMGLPLKVGVFFRLYRDNSLHTTSNVKHENHLTNQIEGITRKPTENCSSFYVKVEHINPIHKNDAMCGIGSISTLILPHTSEEGPGSGCGSFQHTDAFVSDLEEDKGSCTQIAKTLFKLLVQPLLGVPSLGSGSDVARGPVVNIFKGLLLSGPPGTGKTYSVKALKNQFADQCQIVLFDLNIPALLACATPQESLSQLLSLLNKVEYCSRELVDKVVEPSMTYPRSGSVSPSTPKSQCTNVSMSACKFTPSSAIDDSGNTNRNQIFSNPPSDNGNQLQHPPNTCITHNISKPTLCLVVIDEIDALGRENENATSTLLKATLCKWMDRQLVAKRCCGVEGGSRLRRTGVAVVATTNRPNDVDAKLRRGGRLDMEIDVLATGPSDRVVLVEYYIKYCLGLHRVDVEGVLGSRKILQLSEEIGQKTGGFVAADIKALSNVAIEHYLSSNDKVDCGEGEAHELLRDSFLFALEKIQPSCLRGVNIQLDCKLSFDDVIGHFELKQALKRVLMFTNPSMTNVFNRFKLHTNLGGVLLHGPPGNSKTRIVKATASSYNLPLISLSSADVYSAYLGEAEAEIRKSFRIARQASPCILFFDEIDALVTNREHGGSGGNSTSAEGRVLATFLTEMDGVMGNNSNVFLFAATNRLDCIDKALIRKGRFHHVLEVKKPNMLDAIQLFRYFGQKFKLQQSALAELVSKSLKLDVEIVCLLLKDTNSSAIELSSSSLASCGHDQEVLLREQPFSGADIENLCKECLMSAIRCNLEFK